MQCLGWMLKGRCTPVPIDRDAIRTPAAHEILMMRGSIDNKTFEWAINIIGADWLPGTNGWVMQATFQIIGASFSDALDSRLATQRDTIDRLQAHLDRHCSGLATTFCPDRTGGKTDHA